MFIWKGARLSCKRAYFTVALRKAPQLSEANAAPSRYSDVVTTYYSL